MNSRSRVHRDDFATVGSLERVRWLQNELERAFEMKTVIAGHSGNPGVVAEDKFLTRVIRAAPCGLECECDQRRADNRFVELQLKDRKPVGTSGVEKTLKRRAEDVSLGAISLCPALATQYPGLTA